MSDDAIEDQAARADIETELSTSHFVEAGAGTGKTTALVARIVALITSGEARLEHVAAITFTEAAAAELRDRITKALELIATETSDKEYSPEVVELARMALGEIDAAAISTLHGFARRILASHPFEAGIPPTFEVLDAGQSAVAFDDRWGEFLDQLLADLALQPAVDRLWVCGMKLEDLGEIAKNFNGNWDLLVDHQFVALPLPRIDASSILALLDEANALSVHGVVPGDELVAHIGRQAELRAGLHAASDELEVLRLLHGVKSLYTSRGRKGDWTHPIAEVKELLKTAEAEREELLASVTATALSHLLPALRRLTLQSAATRQSEGRLEFHDLLVQSRQLVRHDASARVALHNEFQRLLIDEFQDTDPIQAELAVRIANGSPDPASGSVPWENLDVDPGRLFFVGDPKQAIYRFRRADMKLFLQMREQYLADHLSLTVNFRSVPGIIAWVNDVFHVLIGDGQADIQPAFEGLVAHRPEHEGSVPSVVLLGGPIAAAPGEPSLHIDDIRVMEADEIASTILRIRNEGWPVGDDNVPATFVDMTLLIPTRTGLPVLQDALDEAGVPYRLESSSLVYNASEVQELLSVLQSIDDPTDQVALVAALRSSILGCGDDDLLSYFQAGGVWDYLAPIPQSLASSPTGDGLQLLCGWHESRQWLDVSQIVDRVMQTQRMLEVGLSEPHSRDVWRRLRFVSDQARQFVDNHGGNLHHFLAWVTLQQREDVRAVEVVLPESDDDAVRIMTVHGSKGLEFPIVFLTGLNRSKATSKSVQVIWGPDGPQVKMGKATRTDGFDDLAIGEKEADKAQDLRLLYVAATRASDYLIPSLFHKAKSPCHAASLLPLCDETTGYCGRLPAVSVGAHELTTNLAPPLATEEIVVDVASRSKWIEEHDDLVGRRATPRVMAATTIARLSRESNEEALAATGDSTTKDEVDLDHEPWRRGRAGTEIGRAVHGTLQVVDLATGDGLDDLAQAQAAAEGVLERAGEVSRLVRAALGSDIVRQAVAGGRYWRELYVGAPATDQPDGPVIEGIIDLLFQTPEGYVVVDYKTDAVETDEQRDQAAERYKLQGATYALAIERALGVAVQRCIFLFLRDGGADEREVADLPGALDEVRSVLVSR